MKKKEKVPIEGRQFARTWSHVWKAMVRAKLKQMSNRELETLLNIELKRQEDNHEFDAELLTDYTNEYLRRREL